MSALQGISGLQSLLPTCLTAACPALRTLTIRRCGFQAPLVSQQQQQQQQQQQEVEEGDVLASTDFTPLPQLQTLNLGYCDDVPVCVLTTALAALPRLTNLTLPAEGPTGRDDVSVALAASCGQLTHLAWDGMVNTHVGLKLPSFLTASAAQSKLARLQQLDIEPFDLDDTALRAMMAHLPALTHVTVENLQLQDSHADAHMTCSWEELIVSSITTVQFVARLPLRCIKRVALRCLACIDIHDNNNPAAASTPPTSPAALFAAALAAAPDCTFSCAPDSDRMGLFCPVRHLPAMLPLLARCKGVKCLALLWAESRPERLTPAAVGALGALLEGMPSCERLTVSGFTPNSNALLLSVLARTSVQVLDLAVESVSETHLMLWCAGGAASRAITVTLDESCQVDGDIGNVRTVIAESGGAVRLVVQE